MYVRYVTSVRMYVCAYVVMQLCSYVCMYIITRIEKEIAEIENDREINT